MTRRRLASLMAASAIVIGMLGLSSGSVLAADNTQYWQGNGTTDGQIDNIECDKDNTPGQLWIWTGDGSNVWISVDGEVVAGVQQGNGSFHFATGWHDIGDLTPGDGGNVFVTYDGAADGNAQLTLSHGCPGETEESAPPSFEQSEAPGTEVPPTEAPPTEAPPTEAPPTEAPPTEAPPTEAPPTEAPPTEAPSFEQSQAGETGLPTEPNTATVGGNGSTGPGSNAWLLVLSLGLLLGSVVLLTPAPAKSKR